MINTIISNNIEQIRARIATAASKSDRAPQEIRLVAVGKTQPIDALEAAIASGISIIGENYIQEARTKFDMLGHAPVNWHFIGRLQSNKAKYAVRMFDLIHTVDSLKLAAEIDKQAKKIGKVQEILIQVNISGESTKSGVSEKETLPLAQEISALRNIKLKGFMTMPPYFDSPEEARPFFAVLKHLSDKICAAGLPDTDIKELSMGMTGDFEAAIEEGATLVRIGTAIFGDRI